MYSCEYTQELMSLQESKHSAIQLVLGPKPLYPMYMGINTLVSLSLKLLTKQDYSTFQNRIIHNPDPAYLKEGS